MRREEANDAPNVVTDTFSIKTKPVDVLFDSGAAHSFIYIKLVKTLALVPTYGPPLLSMTPPNGKIVKCDGLYKNCSIQMYEHVFLVDLYNFELTDFCVILRMDWLVKYKAQVNCP